MNVTLTPAAEKFVRRMLAFSGGFQNGFRMVMSYGSCSGLSATYSVEPAPLEGDAVFDVGGLKFFVAGDQQELLEGVTIDFEDNSTAAGLVFHDPKHVSSCSTSAAPDVAGMTQH